MRRLLYTYVYSVFFFGLSASSSRNPPKMKADVVGRLQATGTHWAARRAHYLSIVFDFVLCLRIMPRTALSSQNLWFASAETINRNEGRRKKKSSPIRLSHRNLICLFFRFWGLAAIPKWMETRICIGLVCFRGQPFRIVCHTSWF